MDKRTQLLTSYYFNLSRLVVLKLQHYQNHLQSFLKNDLIYIFVAVLGLHCCTGFSLVAARGGYYLVVTSRLLIAAASLVVEHRLSSWGIEAQLLRGTWSSGFSIRKLFGQPNNKHCTKHQGNKDKTNSQHVEKLCGGRQQNPPEKCYVEVCQGLLE